VQHDVDREITALRISPDQGVRALELSGEAGVLLKLVNALWLQSICAPDLFAAIRRIRHVDPYMLLRSDTAGDITALTCSGGRRGITGPLRLTLVCRL
jgi:hypothetical protein